MYSAYVSGEKPGLILETPYYLGETLNGANMLDIEQEKKVMEDRVNMLKSDHNIEDKAFTLAMKDLGMQRYLINQHQPSSLKFLDGTWNIDFYLYFDVGQIIMVGQIRMFSPRRWGR